LQPFSEKCFITDEYTKVDYQISKAIFDQVSKGLPTKSHHASFQISRVCVSHIELRTNAPNEGLAYHFGVCKATISKVILKWLKLADTRLAGLIHWPDQDALQKIMPECFKVYHLQEK